MGVSTTIHGELHPDWTQSVSEDAGRVFESIINHNGLQHSISGNSDLRNCVLVLASDVLADYEYFDLGTTFRTRFNEGAHNYTFAQFLVYILSQPELADINFVGEFTLLTDSDPWPRMSIVTVEGHEVTVRAGQVVFPEQGTPVTI